MESRSFPDTIRSPTRGHDLRVRINLNLEHEAGIEPAMAVLQTANLPLVDSCNLGAPHRTRTCTPFRAADFKSASSAYSVSSAKSWSPTTDSNRDDISATGF